MWTPRHNKVGTYDDKWLNERWPWFPDDLNPEFFNTAPEDQCLEVFFKGGEAIEIQNMHPYMQIIDSHIPSLRVRCFVTQMKKPGAPPEGDMFREVTTKVDTLWLFPEVLRGVIMYRGSMEVQDDEFADIRRIFLASEDPDQEPGTIEYYRDEQEKAADLSVPFDPAPLQEAQEQVNGALKMIRAIPKEIESMKNEALGKAPRMKYSVGEVHEAAKNVMAGRLADLDDMEATGRALHADFGHKVKINLDMFDQMRAKIKDMGAKIEGIVSKLNDTRKEMDALPQEAKDQVAGQLNEMIPPAMWASMGMDPPEVLVDIPRDGKVRPWHDQGFPFVMQCRKNLNEDQETRDRLTRLGFDRGTVKRAWLGINPEKVSFDPEPWGLPPENPDAGRNGPLTIPAGLVIPRFDDDELKRIIIRPLEYPDVAAEIAVEGSDEAPLCLLSHEGAPVVIAPDDLSAWRVEEEIGDLCSVLSMKDPGGASDDPAATALDQAAGVLVIVPASKAESDAHWAPWADAFENAARLVIPDAETVFEAWQAGVDLRRWILEALPPEMAREHMVESFVPKPGDPPGKFKIPAPAPFRGRHPGSDRQIRGRNTQQFRPLQK